MYNEKYSRKSMFDKYYNPKSFSEKIKNWWKNYNYNSNLKSLKNEAIFNIKYAMKHGKWYTSYDIKHLYYYEDADKLLKEFKDWLKLEGYNVTTHTYFVEELILETYVTVKIRWDVVCY